MVLEVIGITQPGITTWVGTDERRLLLAQVCSVNVPGETAPASIRVSACGVIEILVTETK
jgi:hypothetical protein